MAWCDVIWLQLCGTDKPLPERPVRISVSGESRAWSTSGRITLRIARSDLLRNCILQAMCCSHHTNCGYTPPPTRSRWRTEINLINPHMKSAWAGLSQFDCLKTTPCASRDRDLYAWHTLGDQTFTSGIRFEFTLTILNIHLCTFRMCSDAFKWNVAHYGWSL